MLLRMAARDLAILSLVALLWWQAAPLTMDRGPVGDVLGLLIGLGIGAGTFLLHEWGHCLGALVTRSAITLPTSLRSRYLFSFDSTNNSRAQFLVMSIGGFIVTGVAVWAVYALLPNLQLASRVARGAVLVLAFLTVFLEFPLVIYSLVRPTLPPVETFRARAPDEGLATG